MSEEAPAQCVLQDIQKLLAPGGDWRPILGKRTTQFVILYMIIAGAELTYGLPVITLGTAPFMAALLIFLWDSVVTWRESNKPQIIFYACPAERRFIPIRWADLPRHRKRQACDCGARLIKKCPLDKHFIVSPDTSTALGTDPKPPNPDSVCPFCDTRLPRSERQYLPEPGQERPLRKPWWKFWG